MLNHRPSEDGLGIVKYTGLFGVTSPAPVTRDHCVVHSTSPAPALSLGAVVFRVTLPRQPFVELYILYRIFYVRFAAQNQQMSFKATAGGEVTTKV